jgi:hypothetical protein
MLQDLEETLMVVLDMPRKIAARGLHLAAHITGGLALVERPVVVEAVPGGETFAAARLRAHELFLRHQGFVVVPVVLLHTYTNRRTAILFCIVRSLVASTMIISE